MEMKFKKILKHHCNIPSYFYRINKEMKRIILIFVIGCYHHVALSNQEPIDGEMLWRVNPFKSIRNQFDTTLYNSYLNEVSMPHRMMHAIPCTEIMMNRLIPNLVFRLL